MPQSAQAIEIYEETKGEKKSTFSVEKKKYNSQIWPFSATTAVRLVLSEVDKEAKSKTDMKGKKRPNQK